MATANISGTGDGLRARKRASLRRRIIASAEAAFAKHGYEAATVDDIIGGLEVSRATFFRQFPSKDAILREIGVQMFAALAAGLKRELGGQASAAKKIRQFYDAVAVAVEANAELVGAVVRVGALDPSRYPDLAAERDRTIAPLVAIIKQGQEDGEFRGGQTPAQLAAYLEALAYAAVSGSVRGPARSGRAKRALRDAVDFFLRGVRPD